MNVSEFIAKWRKVALTERSASHQHFLDLCDLLDHPKPAEADPEGSSFTFDRGVHKRGGGDGWADVWKKGFSCSEPALSDEGILEKLLALNLERTGPRRAEAPSG
jgi:hypothetical protein